MKSTNNRVQIVPLGGFGEIGMNCLAIETDEELLIIDCGVLFPSEPRLGVDTIHPDLTYLIQQREKIVGLVATHGHEDHIAGIPYLLEQLDIPIFSGAYTIGLLRSRLTEFPELGNVSMTVISDDQPFQLGSFSITPLTIPHSTIDNFALLLEYQNCRIFHTSDYKLNAKNNAQQQTLLTRLKRLRPVDIMITDSTGALETEDADDEDSLIKPIRDLVLEAPGRVFVALFSSNIERIRNLTAIAEQTGRKLAMSGRSVLNHFHIAKSAGKLPSADHVIIPQQKIHQFKDDKLIILLSGTQGESRSALGRLAANRHSQFTASHTDTVILSSRFIPGNELQIAKTISHLMEQHVTVYHHHNRSHIHVSGHGSRNEILSAIKAVSPKNVLPAHGTYEHLQATEQIAIEAGITNTIVATNGDVVQYQDETLQRLGNVPSGKIFIENQKSIHESLLKDRNRMGNNGLYALWITIPSENKHHAIRVRQQCIGVVQPFELEPLFERVVTIIHTTIDAAQRDGSLYQNVAQQIKTAIRKHVRTELRKNPTFMIEIEWM